VSGNKFKWNSYDDENLVCAYDFGTLTAGGLMKNLARRTGSTYDGFINGTYTPANPLIRAKKTPCMDFNASVPNYISLTNPLNGLTTASVICWINWDSGGNRTVYGAVIGGAPYLYIHQTSGIYASMSASVGNISPPKLTPPSTTVMVAFIFNYPYGWLYLNGKFIDYKNVGPSPVEANIRIGIYSGLVVPYDGRLDNIMFYDRALTLDQVQSIYRSANPR